MSSSHIHSPQSPSIDTVLFDLGGVLIDWNPRYLFRQLFDGDAAAMEHFLANVCSPAWNERLDAGRSWDEAVAEAAAAHPQHRAMICAYRDRWEDMLAGSLPESVEILDQLRRADFRLYALTNWSHATFPRALELYEFLHWFKDILVSGREGLVKPDPAIFRLAMSRFDLEAPRTVFIDDSLKNVNAAAQLGFRTIHFQSPAQLRKSLEDLGVLSKL